MSAEAHVCKGPAEFQHTTLIFRNLPREVVDQLDELPESIELEAGLWDGTLPCCRSELVHELWYTQDGKVSACRPRDEQHVYLYAKVISLPTYHRALGAALVRAALSLLGHYSLLNLALEVSTTYEYRRIGASVRSWFVTCVVVPLVAWLGLCFRRAWGELQAHKRVGDYPERRRYSPWVQDLLALLIFQLLAMPGTIKDAPIVFHTRKPTQPFCTTKVRNQRMWVLGYLSQAQCAFEEDHSQLAKLPLYLFHVPAAVLQAYMLVGLGMWSASSVLTMAISAVFLVFNLREAYQIWRKKGEYKKALDRHIDPLLARLEGGAEPPAEVLDKLGVMDKLTVRDFERRCTDDPVVLARLDQYVQRNFKPFAAATEDDGDECSPLLCFGATGWCSADEDSGSSAEPSRNSGGVTSSASRSIPAGGSSRALQVSRGRGAPVDRHAPGAALRSSSV